MRLMCWCLCEAVVMSHTMWWRHASAARRCNQRDYCSSPTWLCCVCIRVHRNTCALYWTYLYCSTILIYTPHLHLRRFKRILKSLYASYYKWDVTFKMLCYYKRTLMHFRKTSIIIFVVWFAKYLHTTDSISLLIRFVSAQCICIFVQYKFIKYT